jgi:D-glycero-D-manno-heptose 1,7-bisphosphate phosphatase
MSGAPAVFLDRDGTLIEDVGYLDHSSQIVFYPWTVESLRALNRAGLRVIVTTNQSGVARGYFTEAQVREVHDHLSAMLAEAGVGIDAYYYCPHHPEGTVEGYAGPCGCRKPATGMVESAVRDLGVDPRRSFVIGDRWLDVGMAKNAGARGILVKTGVGAAQAADPPPDLRADFVADNLVAAVSWILGELRN